MSRGPGKIQTWLLASAAEREDGYVQSTLIEQLFGVQDSAVRRALRSLEARGLVRWAGLTGTGRNLYEITEAGRGEAPRLLEVWRSKPKKNTEPPPGFERLAHIIEKIEGEQS